MSKKIVIIGAGLTGLSAAENIGDQAEIQLFEKFHTVGGLAHTHEWEDFKFDSTGHFLHFKNEKTKKKVLGMFEQNEIFEIERKSYIYLCNIFVSYPFQSHINHLPEDIKKECLTSFLKNLKSEDRKGGDFYSWMLNQYGDGIVKYFMLPYNHKMWSVHPKELTTEWMSRFVPKPSPEEIISGTVSEGKKTEGYNAKFYYPKNGIGRLADKLAEKCTNINTCNRVSRINWKNRTVVVQDVKPPGEEKTYSYDSLITTAPLKELVTSILEPADEKLLKYAKNLQSTVVKYFNIGWKGGPGKALPEGTHWVYFPEDKFEFYRAGFYPEISGDMSPSGKYSCYVEISASEETKAYIDKELEKRVIRQLKDNEIIPSEAEIVVSCEEHINPAYVIYDKNWNESRNYILNWLEEKGIYSGGRYGGWEYSSMDDAIEWGEKLAKKCLSE